MKLPYVTSSIFTGSNWTAATALAVAIAVTAAQAQPPERPEGPPQRGARGEGFGGLREDRDGPPSGGPGGPREGRGGSRGGGPREGRGGPGGPPSPERFVEHAMRFDADGDGKLDRDELMKFAEEMQRMRQAGGGRGERGPGEGGPRGEGPGFGGRGGRAPGEFGDGDGFRKPPRADEGAPGAGRPSRPE